MERAIDWMKRVLGFGEHAMVRDGGELVHAELRLGNCYVMGAARRGDAYTASPLDLAGIGGGMYVPMEVVEEHYARVRATGEELAREIEDTPYGSREYSLRDPEGQAWSFGTYRPAPPSR